MPTLMINDHVTARFNTRSMSGALAFFGDRSNWLLAPECKAYRVNVRKHPDESNIEIDFMQSTEWPDDRLAAYLAETQEKLTEFCRKQSERWYNSLPRKADPETVSP